MYHNFFEIDVHDMWSSLLSYGLMLSTFVVQPNTSKCLHHLLALKQSLSTGVLELLKVIFIKMRQTEVSFLKIPKFRMECYPLQ